MYHSMTLTFAAINFGLGILGWLIIAFFGIGIGAFIGWGVGRNDRGTKAYYILAGSLSGFFGPFFLGILIGLFVDAQVGLIGSLFFALLGAFLGPFAAASIVRAVRKPTTPLHIPPHYGQYALQQGVPPYSPHPPQWGQPPYPQAQPQYPAQPSQYLPPQQWSSPYISPDEFGRTTVLPGGRVAELRLRWEDANGLHEASVTGAASMVIGRQVGSDVLLMSERVSPLHALVRRRDGAFVVSDLTEAGGQNPVIVNGARVAGDAPLSMGDQITLGDVTLTVTGITNPDRG